MFVRESERESESESESERERERERDAGLNQTNLGKTKDPNMPKSCSLNQ